MTIRSLERFVVALAGSSKLRFYKASVGSTSAGEYRSLWKTTGYPRVGATPTSAAMPVHTDAGTWSLPSGTGSLYLAKLSASTSIITDLVVYDRLMHMGGLSGTSTSVQNTTGMNLTSPAATGRCELDGSGVDWFLEWYTNTGSTAVTATVTYTNEADVTGRTTTVTLAATRRTGMLLDILPASGDISIKSVQSVQLNATTGTAGNFGVTALKRIAALPLTQVGIGNLRDAMSLGMPELQGTECLQLAQLVTAATSGNVFGSMEVMRG